jgi:hypothetical protein
MMDSSPLIFPKGIAVSAWRVLLRRADRRMSENQFIHGALNG